jgi:hypothetical protein
MRHMTKMLMNCSIATVVGFAALFWSGDPFNQQTAFLSSAEARVGRPLTPVSYAGVARRTTRRAVAVGAAARTSCVQVVDAYGRMITRCY